jgi:hypothetical protein
VKEYIQVIRTEITDLKYEYTNSLITNKIDVLKFEETFNGLHQERLLHTCFYFVCEDGIEFVAIPHYSNWIKNSFSGQHEYLIIYVNKHSINGIFDSAKECFLFEQWLISKGCGR